MLSSRGLEETVYILEMSRRKREQNGGKASLGKAAWLGRQGLAQGPMLTDKQELRLMGDNI